MVTDETGKSERPLPRGPFYSCDDEGCAEEYAWTPKDLAWVEWPADDPDYVSGWYCPMCIEGSGAPLDSMMTTLEKELAKRNNAHAND